MTQRHISHPEGLPACPTRHIDRHIAYQRHLAADVMTETAKAIAGAQAIGRCIQSPKPNQPRDPAKETA